MKSQLLLLSNPHAVIRQGDTHPRSKLFLEEDNKLPPLPHPILALLATSLPIATSCPPPPIPACCCCNHCMAGHFCTMRLCTGASRASLTCCQDLHLCPIQGFCIHIGQGLQQCERRSWLENSSFFKLAFFCKRRPWLACQRRSWVGHKGEPWPACDRHSSCTGSKGRGMIETLADTAAAHDVVCSVAEEPGGSE